MPYVADGRILIERAFAGQYAMPAFNVCSLEMARACIEAAELEHAPIILQTYPGDLEQASPGVMAAMIRALAEEAAVPVMLHLDHGDSLELATKCLRAGYSSLMFDGEEFSIEENIRKTREIASIAHAAGVSLEAAAGSFGSGEGKEEALHLTDPEVAARLYEEAKADMVACSVGSRHGQVSQLDLDRLRAIYELVQKPIVLHGGTGIPAEDLKQAVSLGVVKVNIGAGLLRALLAVWQRDSAAAPTHYDVYHSAREALIAVAREKIQIMGGSSKA